MVYFITFVYSLSAPWQCTYTKNFQIHRIFNVFYNFCVYPLCTVQWTANTHPQCLITLARFEKMKKPQERHMTQFRIHTVHSWHFATEMFTRQNHIHDWQLINRSSLPRIISSHVDSHHMRTLCCRTISSYLELVRTSSRRNCILPCVLSCIQFLELHSHAKNFWLWHLWSRSWSTLCGHFIFSVNRIECNRQRTADMLFLKMSRTDSITSCNITKLRTRRRKE